MTLGNFSRSLRYISADVFAHASFRYRVSLSELWERSTKTSCSKQFEFGYGDRCRARESTLASFVSVCRGDIANEANGETRGFDTGHVSLS